MLPIFWNSQRNNHSITAPIAQILLCDGSAQSFLTPRKNHSVTTPSAHIFW